MKGVIQMFWKVAIGNYVAGLGTALAWLTFLAIFNWMFPSVIPAFVGLLVRLS